MRLISCTMSIIMKLIIIDDFQSMLENNYGFSKLHLKLYLKNDLTFWSNVWVKGNKQLCHITSDCNDSKCLYSFLPLV